MISIKGTILLFLFPTARFIKHNYVVSFIIPQDINKVKY